MKYEDITDEDIDIVLSKYPWPEHVTSEWEENIAREFGIEVEYDKDLSDDLERRRFVERLIERAKTGWPALAAYILSDGHGSSPEWAKGVVERADTEDRAFAAYMLCRYCGLPRSWAERIIEETASRPLSDDITSYAARAMSFYCGSPHEWAVGICRKSMGE